MNSLNSSLDALSYFFKLIIHSSSEIRFYSEKFLNNIKKIPGLVFLLLKFISKRDEHEGIYFFSVIFLKNLFFSDFKKNLKKEKFVVINCLIEISASCSTNLINVLTEIIFYTFDFNLENKFAFSFLIDTINQKLTKKIILKNKYEFFYSILTILEKITKLYLIINKHSDLSNDFLNIFEKTIKSIFTYIGKISDSNLNKFQLKVLILLTDLFKTINTNNLVTCVGKNLDSWMLIFFFILDNMKHKDELYDIKLKLKESILNCICELSILYQNEFSIYLPILCDMTLKLSISKINKKIPASIKLLESLNISTNNLIIFRNIIFIKNLKSVFLQIISNHVIYHQKIHYFPIFVYLSGNFNFLKRLIYGKKLVNSICIKKRKRIFKSPELFSQISISHSFLLYMSTITFSTIFSVINGTFIKGVFITYCLPNLKALFHKFYINYVNIEEKRKFLFFTDFISLYRYQLPIKLIFTTANLLFDLLIENEIVCSHFSSSMERILNIRGNDKDGILMFYCSKISKEQLFSFLLRKMNLNVITFMTKMNLKKLFMRSLLNNFANKETFSEDLLKYIIGNFTMVNNKRNNFYSIFDFEILNLLICLNENINKTFLNEIIRFGIGILSENQCEIIPYALDMFVSLLETKKYDLFFPIFLRVFKGLLNPHIWISTSLIKSLLRFLKTFILKKEHVYNKHEIVSLCCIIQSLIDCHSDKEYFFCFLISFLNVIEFQPNFFPHFLELFISKQNFFKKKQAKNYLYLFTILLVGKIGLSKMIKMCNSIQKNLFIRLLELFSSNFTLLKKDTTNQYILFKFFEIFIGKFLTNDFVFLKKIVGKIFRQISIFSRIVDNDNKLIEEEDSENTFRFKNIFSVNNYSIHSYKSFFVIDKLIESIFLFLKVSTKYS